MKKMMCTLTGKYYEIKHRYPMIVTLGKRIDEVKRELNPDACKKITGKKQDRWIAGMRR